MDIMVADQEKPIAMREPTAAEVAEAGIRGRLKEVDSLLDQSLEHREIVNGQIADLRKEQHDLKIALGGFERVRNPRTRSAPKNGATQTTFPVSTGSGKEKSR